MSLTYRENLCLAILKTQTDSGRPKLTLPNAVFESFNKAVEGLTLENKNVPLQNDRLPQGYAHFTSNRVLSGTLSLSDIVQRLKGRDFDYFNTPTESPDTAFEFGYLKTYVANEFKDRQMIDSFFDDINREMQTRWKYQRKLRMADWGRSAIHILPYALFLVSDLGLLLGFIPYINDSFPSRFILGQFALLGPYYLFFRRMEGHREFSWRYLRIESLMNELNRFLRETLDQNGESEYFLVSHTEELDISHVEWTYESVSDSSWERYWDQFQLWVGREPKSIIEHKFLSKPPTHLDFLIEKKPDGRLSVSVLTEFSKKKRSKPRRKKDREKVLETSPLSPFRDVSPEMK